jgi:hypothetical protein
VVVSCYFSGGCVVVERQYSRELYVRVSPSRDIPYRIKQSEEKGSACIKRAKGRKHSTFVGMEEVVGAAGEGITGRPRKIALRLAA